MKLFVFFFLFFNGVLCVASQYERYEKPVLIGSDRTQILDQKRVLSVFKTVDEFSKHRVEGNTLLWQCLEAKNIQMKCVEGGEESLCRLFVVKQKGRKDYFVSRHCDTRDGCVFERNRFKRIAQNQRYACIAGSGFFVSKDDENIWNFEVFKTKSGCMSWFEGACE